MMSARKRSLSIEEEFDSPEKISEEPRTPVDSPNSKKRRHSSLHSETEQLTQLLDDENGPANGKRASRRSSSSSDRVRSGCSTDQSDTDEDENEDEGNEKESLVSVPFDNGKDDGKALRTSRRSRSIFFVDQNIVTTELFSVTFVCLSSVVLSTFTANRRSFGPSPGESSFDKRSQRELPTTNSAFSSKRNRKFPRTVGQFQAEQKSPCCIRKIRKRT